VRTPFHSRSAKPASLAQFATAREV